MLTGITMPASATIASHLLAYKLRSLVGIFELSTIDDPRNGLFLFKAIEESYVRGHICFVYDSSSGHFMCQVPNKTVSQKSWKDYMSGNSSKANAGGTDMNAVLRQFPILEKNSITCLQDLQGKHLHLPAFRSPLKRLLNFHARVSLRFAQLDGVLEDPEWDFEDFGSEGEYAGSRILVQDWLQAVEQAIGREAQEDTSEMLCSDSAR